MYPTSEFLRLKFNFDSNNCVFYENEVESLEHLFFGCELVQSFWSDMQGWLRVRSTEMAPLTVKTVKFCICVENKDLEFVLNTLLLLGMFFIHTCRYYKTKPCLNHWKNELQLFCKSLVKDNKARKLFSLLNKFKLI